MRGWFVGAVVIVAALVAGCSAGGSGSSRLGGHEGFQSSGPTPYYQIGPGDQLQVFVWGNPELSTSVPVRPDGRINTPLVEDMEAAGKDPTELAGDMEEALAQYVQSPIVTIMVTGFVGEFDEQIRVVGEAAQPQALQYRDNLTLLDVMIEVGGLTEFASGNRAKLIREVGGQQKQRAVRLDDLVREGDISANVEMRPGDILIIPEAWF